MKHRYSPSETLRSVSFSMTKPIIDDKYEDECYELAYNLHPKVMAIVKTHNIKNETDILKIFLRDKDVYTICKQLNMQAMVCNNIQEFIIVLHMKEWATQINEYNDCINKLKMLKEKYNLY